MPLSPIPPNPRPTAAELEPEIARRIGLIANGSLARLRWEWNRKRENPDAFLVPFVTWIRARDPRFKYGEYLRSDQWHQIRERVLAAAGNECAACFNKATQVHHRDYRPRVLRGEDDSPLVPLCKSHHDLIHANSDSWQETERRLAEIVAKKDAELNQRLTVSKLVRNNVDGAIAPDFSRRNSERQREYRRLKKLGGGDATKGRAIEDAERRSKMSPYDLGAEDARSRRAAIRTYNARPPDRCTFAKGTPQEAEYDRGWNNTMKEPD